jgi:hypothetical protein
MQLFENRKLIIATKHKKEEVIGPLIQSVLGVIPFTDKRLDTDTLGTFTGEIERTVSPIEALKKKCDLAFQLTNCDLAIASEGSFGPHPSLFFVNANEELLLFVDKVNHIEIIVREISTNTNFNGKYIQSVSELKSFATQALFPSHALVLRKSKDEKTDIFKGIQTEKDLIKTFELLHKKHGTVYVETDMRAMYNPSRMEIIQKATYKLLKQIQSFCPHCQMPGFTVTSSKRGLKCQQCNFPTNSVLSYIYECKHCHFCKEETYPNNKTTEDPTYCDFCNP